MNEIKTSEVLDQAADAIERNGWRRGVKGLLPGGPHCALGAIGEVGGIEATYSDYLGVDRYAMREVVRHPAGSALAEYLRPNVELTSRWVTDWNDTPGRTQQEVIEVLRAAAAVERAKEAAYETADQPLPISIPETSAA